MIQKDLIQDININHDVEKRLNDLFKALAKAMLFFIIKEYKIDQIIQNKQTSIVKNNDVQVKRIQYMVS